MTARIKQLLPALILILIVLGLLVWYMVSVPAPTHTFGTTPTPTATEPAKVTEDATYYTVDATYPTATTLSGASNQAAVATMKSFVEKEIEKFKDNGNFANLTHDDVQMLGLDQRKYALGIEYKMYESASTLSYVYQMYQDTGGAHPNTYYRTFTFDKESGEALELGDLFVPNAPYLETLSTQARNKLPTMIAAMESVSVSEVDTDYINSGTLPEADSFQNFYFEGKNLVLLFPPYQIGPYVLGMITLPIPTADLKDLKPEFSK